MWEAEANGDRWRATPSQERQTSAEIKLQRHTQSYRGQCSTKHHFSISCASLTSNTCLCSFFLMFAYVLCVPIHQVQWLPNMPYMPDMSGRILKCLAESSSTAGHFVWQWSMWRRCPGEKKKCAGHFQIAKCPTGNQNVRQSTECLPDILSCTPEIILVITRVKLVKHTYRRD